jgi:signal transduction histidine kinase
VISLPSDLTEGTGWVRRLRCGRIWRRRHCAVWPTGAFSIRDNGPGISDENLDQVFDSFFTTKADGVGIGLAVCRSIIGAHGGDIEASNLPQGGACIRFSLPGSMQPEGVVQAKL